MSDKTRERTYDLRRAVAYESDTGEVVHPGCYHHASRHIDSKWRRLGMRVLARLHSTWPKGAACAICGGRSEA